MEPFNLVPQTGSFEIIKTMDKNHSQVIRQTVLQVTVESCRIILHVPIAVIGNSRWADLYLEVEASIGDVNNTDGVFIAGRIKNAGCQTFQADGIFFFVYPSTNKIVLSTDLALTQVIFTGSYSNFKQWNTLSLALHSNLVTAMINGDKVLSQNVSSVGQGFAGLGTSKFGLADFDNLKIMTLSDGLERMKELSNLRKKNNNLYFKPGRL